MSSDEQLTSIKTLQHLRLLLCQDDDGLERYLYPHLGVGDIWWIPDEVTGFAKKERHPWVIVQGYSKRRTTVVACPCTTSIKSRRNGIIMPADMVLGLDRPGLIILNHRRSFSARRFREWDYIGKLPNDFILKIQEFQSGLAKGKAGK